MAESFLLHNGRSIPSVGLGTWKSEKKEVGQAVKIALLNGYKHIDCAHIYKNEEEIGEIHAELFSGPSPKIKREEIFITSKLWNTHHRYDDVLKACDQTLKDLRLDYLDLYLIHWPLAYGGSGAPPKDEQGKVIFDQIPIRETWTALEELVRSNKVRAIGTSNFSISRLKEILSFATIKPAVNQVELHPYLPQDELVKFCQENNIHVTAYSPLGGSIGNPPLREDPIVLEVAKKVGKEPAQVLLAWALKRGISVIPKSVKQERIISNFDCHFDLDEESFQKINSIPTRRRYLHLIDFFGGDVFLEKGDPAFLSGGCF